MVRMNAMANAMWALFDEKLLVTALLCARMLRIFPVASPGGVTLE